VRSKKNIEVYMVDRPKYALNPDKSIDFGGNGI
jgi:hypothetical protein